MCAADCCDNRIGKPAARLLIVVVYIVVTTMDQDLYNLIYLIRY